MGKKFIYACFIFPPNQSTTQSFCFAHLHISLCHKINTLNIPFHILHFLNFMNEVKHKRDLFDHNQNISEMITIYIVSWWKENIILNIMLCLEIYIAYNGSLQLLNTIITIFIATKTNIS